MPNSPGFRPLVRSAIMTSSRTSTSGSRCGQFAQNCSADSVCPLERAACQRDSSVPSVGAGLGVSSSCPSGIEKYRAGFILLTAHRHCQHVPDQPDTFPF